LDTKKLRTILRYNTVSALQDICLTEFRRLLKTRRIVTSLF